MRYQLALLLGLSINSVLWAAEVDTDVILRQQAELQRQQQEQQIVNDDNFFSGQQQEEQFEINTFADLTLALLTSINNKDTQVIQQLLEFYRIQPQAEEGMILFAEANIDLNQNRWTQAIDKYKKLVENEPHFSRGKLDLARLYFADYQLENSRRLFAEIDLPDNPNVMEKVKTYQAELDNRESWHGSFALGFGYTRNLNQTSRKKVELTVSDPLFGFEYQYTREAQPMRSAASLKYEATLDKYHNLISHHGLSFKASGYGDIYRNNSTDTEHNFSLGLGYGYRDRHHNLSLLPVFESVHYGNHLYLTRKGARLEYAFNNLERLYSMVTLEYKNERYKDKKFNHYDGQLFSLFGTQVFALSNKVTLFGGVNYSRKGGTALDADKYQRYGVYIGTDLSSDMGVDLNVSANLRQTHYRGYDSLLNAKRKDNEQIYNISLKIPHWEFWGFVPSVNYKHTKVRSNVDWLYSYNKNETYFKLEKFF